MELQRIQKLTEQLRVKNCWAYEVWLEENEDSSNQERRFPPKLGRVTRVHSHSSFSFPLVPSFYFPPFPHTSPPLLHSCLPNTPCPHPQIKLGVCGMMYAPQQGLGWGSSAPAVNAFACVLGWEIAAGGEDFPSLWSDINVCNFTPVWKWNMAFPSNM